MLFSVDVLSEYSINIVSTYFQRIINVVDILQRFLIPSLPYQNKKR